MNKKAICAMILLLCVAGCSSALEASSAAEEPLVVEERMVASQPEQVSSVPETTHESVETNQIDDLTVGRIVEIYAHIDENNKIVLGEDEDYVYKMLSPNAIGQTTLNDVAAGQFYSDVLIRECKKIDLTNLSGSAGVTRVGIGETFLGLTVTDIKKSQYLVENQWVDYNVRVVFSGVTQPLKGVVYFRNDQPGLFEISEESFDYFPSIILDHNPAAKIWLETNYYTNEIGVSTTALRDMLGIEDSYPDGINCEIILKDYHLDLVWETGLISRGEIVQVN